MFKFWTSLLFVFVLFCLIYSPVNSSEFSNNKMFVDKLQVNQKVSVSFVDGKYEFTIYDNPSIMLVSSIADIGNDYISVRDLSGRELIIPVYSIKSITIIKIGENK